MGFNDSRVVITSFMSICGINYNRTDTIGWNFFKKKKKNYGIIFVLEMNIIIQSPTTFSSPKKKKKATTLNSLSK